MILFGSNADTELLALRSVVDDLRADVGPVDWFHPDRIDDVPSLDGVDLVAVRLLGGVEAWPEGFATLCRACSARAIPLVAAGGEASPDPDLVAASSVPTGVAAQAHAYLAAGGPQNMANLVRFLSDTLLLSGAAFDPPAPVPDVAIWPGAGLGRTRRGARRRPSAGCGRLLPGPRRGREHDIRRGIVRGARRRPALMRVAIWTYSLRRNADGAVPALDLCRAHGVDAIITSTLASGAAADDGDGWDVPGFEDVDVPVIQAPAVSRSRADWRADDAGLSPLDVATGVAIPEFDGRRDRPVVRVQRGGRRGRSAARRSSRTRADPERTRQPRRARGAHRASRDACPSGERRVAIVLSAYPTKRARLGNAVGLDTPASAVELLDAMRAAGYRVARRAERRRRAHG